jgi:hypothetical protein
VQILIGAIVIANPDRKRIAERPLHRPAMHADGDVRIRRGRGDLPRQRRGGLVVARARVRRQRPAQQVALVGAQRQSDVRCHLPTQLERFVFCSYSLSDGKCKGRSKGFGR